MDKQKDCITGDRQSSMSKERMSELKARIILLLAEMVDDPHMAKVTLLVDAKEPFFLRNFFLTSGLNVQQVELPVGDYWLIYDGYLLHVYERKALGDLNGAFFNRHDAQYWCLCQLPLPRENINYLVVRQDESKIECFKGMYFVIKELGDMATEQGIHAIWEQNEEELQLEILLKMSLLARKGQKLLEEIPDFSDLRLPVVVDLETKQHAECSNIFRNPTPRRRRIFGPLKDWASYAKISRLGNDTPESLFKTMIRTIRGMGTKVDDVVRVYPSFAALHDMMVQNEKKSIGILQNLKLRNGKNLGPAMAKKLICAVYSGAPEWMVDDKKNSGVKRKK